MITESQVSPPNKIQEEGILILAGAQDFQSGRAFVSVLFKKLVGYKVAHQLYLITSDRKKILYNEQELAENGIVTERRPTLHTPGWEEYDLDKFIEEGIAPSIEDVYGQISNESVKVFDFVDYRWHSFLALWIIGTYFHRMFPKYPYIHLNGNAGSGKTKCLTFIAALGFNGELSVGNTPSYMIRIIDRNSATCCLDEVERLNRTQDDNAKTVVNMLNAGYKRGSYVGKSEPGGKGEKWEPKRFEAYSPKVLAGIQNLPYTLATRCVPILMLKSSNLKIVNNEVDELDVKWKKIRNQLYRLLLVRHEEVLAAYSQLTDSDLFGRAWELWHPIFALAKTVNQSVYEEVRSLALDIEKHKEQVETPNIIGPSLLKAIYDYLDIKGYSEQFLSTSEMYGMLANYDQELFGWLDSPDKKTKPGRWLTRELRLAGAIDAGTVQKKISGRTTKGYILDKDKIS